ncbi:MAG: 30S ribosomal protein S15 [Parcubacteria group bacterium]|nr:30S ribosomal protein S15 [Parcubacteria group bacterium]
MALTGTEKTKLIKKHAVHEKDTGSAEVQVALFSEEIKRLAKHLEKHKKDNSSRRGILKMVSKRKRLLDFLKKEDHKRYASLIKKLELKK